MYTIKARQKRAAKRIGFSIKPSTDPKKNWIYSTKTIRS